MLFGGGQEFGLRPGTENVADAIGLAAAAKLVTRDLDSLGKPEWHFVYFFRTIGYSFRNHYKFVTKKLNFEVILSFLVS